MKQYTILCIAATLFAAVSCSREMDIDPEGLGSGYELLLRTEIDGMATRATVPDVSDLQEDAVKTLDVYISGTFKGESSASVKGFHLNAGDHYDQTTGLWRVLPDWRAAKLVPGNDYKIYVAANSSKVKMSDDSATQDATATLADLGITSLEALGDAIEFDYNPSETNDDGGHYPFWGANDDDGVNPAWLGVHKKYTATENIASVDVKADRYFTHDKSFLMNGTLETFSPAASDGEITPVPAVTLTRAASKIQLNVTFDPGFLTKLASEKHRTLCGDPHWRFFNFAFNAPVFSDLDQSGSYDPTVSRFTSGADMIGYDGVSGNDLKYAENGEGKQSFSFSTYSYPLSWTAATAGEEAPAIIISVGYRDDSNTSISEADRPVTYQSYKIPVVDPEAGLYSLDRNYIYTVNANISSEGSLLVTDAYEVNAAYSILPWDDTSALPISGRDNSYIDVIPDAIAETTDVTDVILRGNGEQTFRLHVLKPDTKDFSIAYYGTSGATHADPFGQNGTPTNYPFTGSYTDEKGNVYDACATGAQVPYYFNLNGEVRNTIVDNGVPNPYVSNDNIQNCFVKDGNDIVIISTALPNKGVKYMKIRVFLTDKSTVYMDVNIRHYPTDAITSIEGRWSSRQSALLVAPEEYRITTDKVVHGPEDYTFTESEATRNAYDSYTGYKRWVWVECDKNTYDNKPEDERSVEIGVISQVTFKAHTSDGTVYGDPETDYEKHVDDYQPFFYKNGTNISYDVRVASSATLARTAIDEANAFRSSKNDESGSYVYYWGQGTAVRTGSQRNSAALVDYDYYYQEGSYYHSYQYPVRKRVYYTGPIYKYKKYYTITTSLNTSAPRWINWDNDLNASTYSGPSSNRTYYQGAKYWGGGIGTAKRYYAKIITDGAGTVSYTRPSTGTHGTVSVSGSSDAGDWCIYNGYQSGESVPNNLIPTKDSGNKNPYMFVLQQSETSGDFTIGRPILNPQTYLSDDNVVSPAFMIASQLAYETTGTGAPSSSYAALHCASYLEVAKDGTYYTGWRLPTRAEIQTMINYQGKSDGTAQLVPDLSVSGSDRVMDPVLFAKGYIALDGIWVLTNYGSSTAYSVRCVRDLTPEEIEMLNN